jgi:Tol biopolymer transport system component
MPVPLPNSYTVVKSRAKSRKAYHPDWSPDGKYIAFSYGSGSEQVGETGAWDICVVRSNGGPWVALTKNQGANKEPDWCVPAE